MFYQTSLGACAPVLLIDSPADPALPRHSRIPARTAIMLCGASRPTALRILDGCVALYRELADGRRLILDILGPGRLLGEALVDVQQCKAIALTLTHVESVDMDRESASAATAMRQMLLRAQSHALLLGRKSASERVATALLDLAGQFARKSRASAGANRTSFFLHLTRADLADWLGLTLETVSRCLGALKRSRLIAFDQPELITIRDRTALEALACGHSSARTA